MIKSAIKQIVPTSLWTKLRLIKLKSGVKNYKNKIVTRDYGGHTFDVAIEDDLGNGWYNCDWKRLAEIEFLSQHGLRKGSKVFDFGAHQGVVAMMLSREVGDAGEVIALEANSHNYKVAIKNKNLNKLENLIIRHCALGETSGTLNFNEGLNGQVDDGSGAWGKVEVKSLSVDDTTKEYGKPDVIFMDIEGFEYCALKGAQKTLDMNVDWFVEVHGAKTIGQFGGTVEDTLEHFTKRDFKLYMANERSEFHELDLKSSMIQKRFDLTHV